MNNNNQIESNSIVFAGPFLGEFGWELSHWMPHVRWLREQYKGRKLIVASYAGRHPLYYGIANEFWNLPDWFTKEKYDCDCFESLCGSSIYARLTKYFKDKLDDKYDSKNVVWTKTPRGFNKTLRQNNYVLFDKLNASESACAYRDNGYKLANGSDKPLVILFAREMHRKTFLDVKHNQIRYCEDLRNPLPSNNWPRSHWEDLFGMLYKRFHNQVAFVIGGTKSGNCLLNMVDKYDDVIDLTNINIPHSLDITIAMLNSALCSISSQSGPTHLSVQCGCPSFIYGHERQRHSVDDNPLGTDVVFLETQLGLYNDLPEVFYKDAAVYIKYLLNEKMGRETFDTGNGALEALDKAVKDGKVIEYEHDIPFEKAEKQKKDIIGECQYVDDGFGTEVEINGKKYITAHDPACLCDECREFKGLNKTTKIKKIGIVGVFDVTGSTNIPFGKAFVNAGYQVDTFNYRTVARGIGWDKANQEIVKFSAAYDLIIFCKCNGVMSDTIKSCGRNAITCWYFMDSIDHIKADPNYYKMAGAADFSIVTTKAVYDALADGKIKSPDIYHVLQGIDPKEFYPVESEKKYDVVFIGQRTAKRDIALMAIKNAGYSVKAYGQGYNNPVYGRNFNIACSEGRILLAINNSDPDQDSFSDRMFRYMATKGCVLTEYSKGLEIYFMKPKFHWFKTELQMMQEIKRLLDNANLRNITAENGYKTVLANHTWDKVAEQIIQIATGEEKQNER